MIKITYNRPEFTNPWKKQKIQEKKIYVHTLWWGPGRNPWICFVCSFFWFSWVFFACWIFRGKTWLFFLKGWRVYFLFSADCAFFSKQRVPSSRNLHKGMPHCPQWIPWPLKVQSFIDEYPFKILFDFARRRLKLFRGKFNGIKLHWFMFYSNITPFHRDCYFLHLWKGPFSIQISTVPHMFENNSAYTCVQTNIFQNNTIEWNNMLFYDDVILVQMNVFLGGKMA